MRVPSRRALLGWLIAVAVVALGALALVDALHEGTPRGERSTGTRRAAFALHGPDVPAPGALPGVLVVTQGVDCRLRLLDLGRLTLGAPGPATSCRIWASPRGGLAMVARPGKVAGRLRPELWLASLGDPPRLERRLDIARSAPSWSPDGNTVSWCRDDGSSAVLDVRSGELRTLSGCYPQVISSGRIVTRERVDRSTTVRENGRALIDQRDLERALPDHDPIAGPVRVFGAGAQPDGTLVLGVLEPARAFAGIAALELWSDGRHVRSIPIATPYVPAALFYGLRIEVSPDGTELALLFPETLGGAVPDDLAAFVDLRSGRLDTELTRQRYAGLAWSPDSGWLALSTGTAIDVYGTGRSGAAYVLPVAAESIGWIPRGSAAR